MLFTDAFFSSWIDYLGKRREYREYRDTVNAVSELPAHIRRDIGWPGQYERQRNLRRSGDGR